MTIFWGFETISKTSPYFGIANSRVPWRPIARPGISGRGSSAAEKFRPACKSPDGNP
jgi:hypothetical protein